MLNQHEEKLYHYIEGISAVLQPAFSLSASVKGCSEYNIFVYYVIQKRYVLNEATVCPFEKNAQ